MLFLLSIYILFHVCLFLIRQSHQRKPHNWTCKEIILDCSSSNFPFRTKNKHVKVRDMVIKCMYWIVFRKMSTERENQGNAGNPPWLIDWESDSCQQQIEPRYTTTGLMWLKQNWIKLGTNFVDEWSCRQCRNFSLNYANLI